MIFAEPPRTEYDWNFRLLGIPVRVHPMFWLLALLLGAQGQDARALLVWVVAVFVSILVHEFGHALTIQYFGWSPHVVLYSFGGLAIYDPRFSVGRGRNVRHGGMTQILISLAGPFAGFGLAVLIVAMLFATQKQTLLVLFGRIVVLGTGSPLVGPLGEFVFDLVQINIYWGLLNLLPIYPLDGGQVSREIFLAKSADGHRQALMLSFVMAAMIAFAAVFFWSRLYMGFMFGYMAYSNYQQLTGPFGGSFGGRRPW